MTKIAKLVTVELTTRVVVNQNADEETILNTARTRFVDKILTELEENIVEIVDDTEFPYEPEYDLHYKGG
jgi:hypothetical protein